jgi:phospholipid/cholesterol/gamma-HCH transport system substrate-binding protein
MPRDRNALRAGIFILVSTALVIGVVIAIKGTEQIFEPKQEVVISFPLAADVGGLRRGDDLRIGGYKVGAVGNIELQEIEDPAKTHADVHVSLPRKYVLRKDARVMIQTTFTGQSWINVESLGSAPPLAAGDRLAGRPAAFTSLVNALGQVGPELHGAVSDFRQTTIPKTNAAVDQVREMAKTYQEAGQDAKLVVGKVKGKIDPLSDKTAAFLDRGAEMMVKVRDLFGDVTVDFRTAVANVREATQTIKEKLPGLLGNMDQAVVKLSNTIDSLDLTLKDAKVAVTDARGAMASIHDVIVNNRGKLDGIIDSLKTTSDNLKGASSEVRRSPWRLLYKPSDKEQANFKVITTAREFADGASELNEAAMALRDAARNPHTKPEQIDLLLKRLDQQFRNFKGVEGELWKDLK